MGIDIYSPKPDDKEKADSVRASIEEVLGYVRHRIAWGLFGNSGELIKLTEVRDVEKLGPEDASKFQELYLRGPQEEPSSFGSNYEIESKKGIQEVEDFIKTRYVVGVKFTYIDEEGKDQEKLVGVGHLRREEGVSSHIAHVGTLYVDKAYRGRGLAEKIARHRLNYAKEQGIEQVHGVVTASNKFVLDFNKKMGFKEQSIHHNAVMIDGVYYDWVKLMLDMSKYQPEKQ